MRFLRSLRSVGMTSRTVISTGAKRNGDPSEARAFTPLVNKSPAISTRYISK